MVLGLRPQKIVKAIASKALVIRINLVFLAFPIFMFVSLILRWPSSSVHIDNAGRCSLRECHHKAESGVKMKAVLDESNVHVSKQKGFSLTKIEVPSFVGDMGKRLKIGMVNMDVDEDSDWEIHGETVPIHFERVPKLLKWEDLFPEWIDEEEKNKVPSCPEIPMPDFKIYGKMDMIVAKLPCKYPEEGWNREVFRLQVHLIAAKLAVEKGKRDGKLRTKVLLRSKCRPMMELFRCDDLVRREGEWWLFEPEVARLEHKISLPVGSCKLSLPIWSRGINGDRSEHQSTTRTAKREAYVTVLHSSESYVCGAITLAQSLLRTGTKRDLVLLIDKSISRRKRDALVAAGWEIRLIKRIRNPRAQKKAYNEYNYSKFRLWQLADYDKIVFIDSDILVLRNLDLLFRFPQMSATGNDIWMFNSGIMIIEPSNCTFKALMDGLDDVVSYNGGDQGFLNEVFVWWHRLSSRVNFLKNFWANTTAEATVKNGLMGADPPKLYAIHYLGLKPWHCYRDYDCNWNRVDHHVYASNVAHERWWKFHDSMDEKLQKFCVLTKKRKLRLDSDRKLARNMSFRDEHGKIKVKDPRRSHTV
ncbi:hypothetical protein K2173_026137 [Erythroxylum novogranatense]|uniref:Hexosyltransferase n=1 Tax=Erythroxylum novogranatense TaxID=1862640 RepID=A0AAV8T8V4_9ROSI|nr:hypothetical protein K2173_026137 [Erythroxylum novogranatense]